MLYFLINIVPLTLPMHLNLLFFFPNHITAIYYLHYVKNQHNTGVIHPSTINLNKHLSRFIVVVLEYVTSGIRFTFYGTEGVYISVKWKFANSGYSIILHKKNEL